MNGTRFELVVLDGSQAGRRLPVSNTPCTIGRSEKSEVSFPEDSFMSGVHLSVQLDQDGVLVTDLRSTNGTFLNGQRITQAVAGIGDVFQLGTLSLQVAAPIKQANVPVFSSTALLPDPMDVHSVKTAAANNNWTLPQTPVPGGFPMAMSSGTTTIPKIFITPGSTSFGAVTLNAEPRAAHDAMLAVLAAEKEPLFALVNADRDGALALWLERKVLQLQRYTLWLADAAPLPGFAPFLVPLEPASPLLRELLENGWERGWASFLTSRASYEELRNHFGRFLMVQAQGGGDIYFRFYEPGVLRQFFTAANQNELAMFFGATHEWLLEGERPGMLLRVKNTPAGLVSTPVPLV